MMRKGLSLIVAICMLASCLMVPERAYGASERVDAAKMSSEMQRVGEGIVREAADAAFERKGSTRGYRLTEQVQALSLETAPDTLQKGALQEEKHTQGTGKAQEALPQLTAGQIDGGVCGNAAVWSLDGNGVLTISGKGATYDMQSFNDCWMPVRTSIKEVVIGDGITALGDQAFFDCGNLEAVTFGTGLKSIGLQAFAYCVSLTAVELPANVTSIDEGCFGETASLVSFRSAALKKIPYQAFLNCPKLTSVSLNEGITEIGAQSFITCRALKSVTIPKSVTYIAESAFPDTVKLKILNEGLKDAGSAGYLCLDAVKLSGKENYKMAYEVLSLVNKQRGKQGLSKLKMDQSLLKAAMQRSAETAVYFSHTRPSGLDCFTVDELVMGENIAVGQRSSASVMNGWMNSPGHRENILRASYKSIGIGCFQHNGQIFWAQCFGTESAKSVKKPSNKTVTAKILLAPKSYRCKVTRTASKIAAGKTAKLAFQIQNPGFSYFYAQIKPDSVKWVSSNSKTSVGKSGSVYGHVKGSAKVTGKLVYHKASVKIAVTGSIAGTVKKGKYKVTGSKSAAYAKAASAALTKVTIPEKVKLKGRKYPVTTISADAFKNVKKMKTAAIGKNVTKIGKSAFAGCKELRMVTIKSTKVSAIGKGAFKGIRKGAVIKVPAKKLETYTKLLRKAGVSESVTIAAF